MRVQVLNYLQSFSSLFFHGEHRHRQARLLILALIVALAGFAIWDSQPRVLSQAKPASTGTSTAFSLSDAQAQLAQLALEKHPIGSAASLKVRDYIVDQIRALGYTPHIQSDFVNVPAENASAQVANIVVRIIGSQSGKKSNAHDKALLLTAHYDSAPNSYGASDDGVSVVSILQTLRMLKETAKTAPLANDLIVLITDGEEAGLLGAEAFAQFHPWIKDVGMVLNFDNRGNAGPVLMFETSSGNAPLITSMAQALPNAVTNSVMYEVYKAMPNDTDLTVFRKRDLPSLNFGIIPVVSQRFS